MQENEIRDLGDSVLWLGRTQLRGVASHVELDQEFAFNLLVSAGKIVRIQGFLEWREALEDAGGRE